MISQKIQDAINQQINTEIWSAYLYLSMSMDAFQKEMPGMSNWFYVQWQEELDHARILQRYMQSQSAKVILKAIAAVPIEWDDPEELLRETLMHEQEVTSCINEIAQMAQEERDYATLSRIQWFIDEQIEEEEQARSMLASLRLIGDDSYGTYEFDQQLGRRRYHLATPLQ